MPTTLSRLLPANMDSRSTQPINFVTDRLIAARATTPSSIPLKTRFHSPALFSC